MKIRKTVCLLLAALTLNVSTPARAQIGGTQFWPNQWDETDLHETRRRELLESLNEIFVDTLLLWMLLCGLSRFAVGEKLKGFKTRQDLVHLAALIARPESQRKIQQSLDKDELRSFHDEFRDICTQIIVYEDFILEKKDYTHRDPFDQVRYLFLINRTLRLALNSVGWKKRSLTEEYVEILTDRNVSPEMQLLFKHQNKSSQRISISDLDDIKSWLIKIAKQSSINVDASTLSANWSQPST